MSKAATLPQDSRTAPRGPLGTPDHANAHQRAAHGEIEGIERRRAKNRERQQRFRERQRHGLEVVRIVVGSALIDDMIALGLVPDVVQPEKEAIALALLRLAAEHAVEMKWKTAAQNVNADLYIVAVGVSNEMLDLMVSRGCITEAEALDGDRIAEIIAELAIAQLTCGGA